MKRREFSRIMSAAALTPVLTPIAAASQERRRWSITADLAECCSCAIPCGCNFGRPERVCHGTRLYRIRQGHFEGENLAGIDFVVTFDRTNWTRIYADEAMSAAQAATFDRLLPVAFGGFDGMARARERVPISIESTVDTFAFSVPESRIEMRLLPGLDGDVIRVTGLPNPAYRNYIQYESVVHTHESADGRWSHSGTNGFVSEMLAGA